MAADGNSEAMDFIKPNLFNRPSLSVSQDSGLANKLGLGMVKFGKDRGRSRFSGRHGLGFVWVGIACASHMKACKSRQRDVRGTRFSRNEIYLDSDFGVAALFARHNRAQSL